MGVQNAALGALNAATSSSDGTDADLVVGGTFVGTIQLQASIPGASGADLWVSVGQLTAPGLVKVQMAIGRKFRAVCTAYTSGTAYVSLGVSLNEDLVATV